MNENAAGEIAWDVAGRLADVDETRARVEEAVRITVRALQVVPDSDLRYFEKENPDDRQGRLFVIADDALYLADVDYGDGAQNATVTISTRRLAAGSVELTQHGKLNNREAGRLEFRRDWKFMFPGAESVTVRGWVTGGALGMQDVPDAGEEFGRRLAGMVGASPLRG